MAIAGGGLGLSLDFSSLFVRLLSPRHLQVLESAAALANAEHVVDQDSHEDVEDNVDPDDAKVAPAVAPVDLGTGKEVVGDIERAELAARRGILSSRNQMARGGGALATSSKFLGNRSKVLLARHA